MQIVPALVLGVILAGASVQAEPYKPPSADEAAKFQQSWTIDNWDDGGPLMHYVFLNMGAFFPQAVIARAGPIRELPVAINPDIAAFATETRLGKMSLADYVTTGPVNGVVVLHRGKVVYEAYPGMRQADKHLFMSVSKPYAATLIAILEDQEKIDSSRSIETYLPELKSSGWEGISVRDILDMASGIACLETDQGAYTDPNTCYYQYEATLGWLKPTAATKPTTYAYMASLRRAKEPGTAFEYTSVNTFMLAWLAESVTGRPFADLVATEIWQKTGATSDGLIVISKAGAPMASGGISGTLRDMARFGLLFTPSGRMDSADPVISDAHLAKIQKGGRPNIYDKGPAGKAMIAAFGDDRPSHNSWQWDFVMPDGDFYKGGYGGQGLYVSPRRDLVIAFFGTFEKIGEGNEMVTIARQFALSEFFNE